MKIYHTFNMIDQILEKIN